MIRLTDLRKSYADGPDAAAVVEVAEWSVAAGERVALVGASGSGKTTLLNLVSGLVLPDRGRVEVAGTDIAALGEPQRDRFRAAHCGYMFQAFHLLEGFTALENVELGASFAGHRVDRVRAAGLLDAFGLGDRLHHDPRQLSIGQRARCALARALINRPVVLLADEPTGSLDPPTAAAVLELLLATVEAEGTTLLCATHDLDLAARLGRVQRVEELR
jgi:ABC-type lipoprotein export system ATPase subunit